MSISYQPRQAQVQDVQLKVQQLVLKSSDTEVLSGGGTTTITVNFSQAISEIRVCLHVRDGVAAPVVIAQSAIAYNAAPVLPAVTPVARSIATITLANALAANDALIIDFVAAKA